ncbi:MAG: FAD-dependent oxidoreductase [Rhodobacteraceae bacterium]|nr:FAD-dependent oxidoreductase [Paracoccaceae bacterium]
MDALPDTAGVVIIGGGVAGCSTAYHLGKLGWTDTVLLERRFLTSGTTFHAAGLVGQLRAHSCITEMLRHSVDLYQRLEAETGVATGWKMTGGLRLACSPDRLKELRRQASLARSFGLDMEVLTPDEARTLWPPMSTDDVVGATFLPTDGQVNPSDLTAALAKGARMTGVRILENTEVLSLEVDSCGKAVAAVETGRGRITCGAVVCCAGQWTRWLAASVGVSVPLVPLLHQYLVTTPVAGLPAALPTLRDPDRRTYFKEDAGKLVMGGYEANPVPWAGGGSQDDSHFCLLPPDWDQFEQLMQPAIDRVPALKTAGVRQLINGPESFTPDGHFILGEAPELRNFYVGAGFNAFGIAAAGGAGMALARLVCEREPPFDLGPVDIRRFGAPHRNGDWVGRRTRGAYAAHYSQARPRGDAVAGFPYRHLALHDELKSAGGRFGEKFGWEQVDWFAGRDQGDKQFASPGVGTTSMNEAVAGETRAATTTAVLVDRSSCAKLRITGPDACEALKRVAAGEVSGPVETAVHSPMLNDRGGIECDALVARVAPDDYYLVGGVGTATRISDWIRRWSDDADRFELRDGTEESCALTLLGPEGRAILGSSTPDDVSEEGFPAGRARHVRIGPESCLAIHVTSSAGPVWELHVPIGTVRTVYRVLVESGQEFGLRLAGNLCLESLRLEEGRPAWGSDIGPDTTPLEAGLEWATGIDRGADFKGRDALIRQRRVGVTKIWAGFSTGRPGVELVGGEAIIRNGRSVGWLTSGGFGHNAGRAMGYGFVRCQETLDRSRVLFGKYELDVSGACVPADVHLGSFP